MSSSILIVGGCVIIGLSIMVAVLLRAIVELFIRAIVETFEDKEQG